VPKLNLPLGGPKPPLGKIFLGGKMGEEPGGKELINRGGGKRKNGFGGPKPGGKKNPPP